MPIYDYRCENEECNWEGELFVLLHDRDQQECPICKTELIRDTIPRKTSFTLKGSGWYKSSPSCEPGGG
jgi:putative FmdB family regulatory protein